MEPPHHVSLREDQISLRPYSTPQEAYKRKDIEFIWSITSYQVQILFIGNKCENILLLGRSVQFYCCQDVCYREAKVNASLGESKETSKIEILVVISLYFMLWIGRSKSSKLDCFLKLSVTTSYCIVEVAGKSSNIQRLTWCGGKVQSLYRVKSL